VYFPRTKNRPTRPNLDRGSAAKGGNPREWIAVGKIYPSTNIPSPILMARSAVLISAVTLQTYTFANISSDLFLCLLSSIVQHSPDKWSLDIDASGYGVFAELGKSSKKFLLATKALVVARRRGNRKEKGAEPANGDEE
jgi:hypothetical protein